jgi:hypothetical protein
VVTRSDRSVRGRDRWKTRRCAFLTIHDLGGYVTDDELVHAPLRERGIVVEPVPWDRPGVAWERYDLVVIRSTWDYHERVDEFLATLAGIAQRAPLRNDPAQVAWNARKSYLGDLAARGVPIVPTVFRDRLAPGELAELFDELGADEIVVKPLVGANAHGAFRLDRATLRARGAEAERWFAERALLAQPFVPSVLADGEWSLCFLGGAPSHAIRKVPRSGDFRVQEEHGASIHAATAEPALWAAGAAALGAFDKPPLYARADFVRADDGASFWLMELELIEPSLYLRMDPGAPERFATAIAAALRRD